MGDCNFTYKNGERYARKNASSGGASSMQDSKETHSNSISQEEWVVNENGMLVPKRIAEKAVDTKKQQNENYDKNSNEDIPGLDELNNAIYHNQAEEEKFSRSIYGGSGIIYSPKLIDIEALRKKYPRAEAYRHAQNYSYSSNYEKASLGREAMDKIRKGADYKKAIQEMEKKWSDYAEKHFFD